jgi:diguanylate cyclase (GGDEF)-like protein
MLSVSNPVIQMLLIFRAGSMPKESDELVVLVVSGDHGEIMSTILAHFGFRILVARLGTEAVRMYQEHQAEIDLVLLNYSPDICDRGPSLANQRFSDGPATFDALRAVNPDVRCVFMSASFTPEVREGLMKRGAIGCLDKPFRLDELAAALRGFIARRFRMSGTSDHLKRFLQRLTSWDEREGDRLRVADQKEERTGDCWNNMLTDPLTELPNRKAIIALAEQELQLWHTSSTPFALIQFDVDGMKSINDQYLFPGGDVLLNQLGELLASTVSSDEFVGRFGGDRFLIVACNSSAFRAVAMAERLDEAVRQATFRYRESEIRITISIGISVAEDGTASKSEVSEDGMSSELRAIVMASADRMYEFKRRNRGTR